MLKPLPAERWDFSAAAHLLNRVGFGGPPAEIEKLVEMGQAKAVAHLADFENVPDPTANPDWAQPEPQRMDQMMAAREMAPAERQKLLMQDRQQEQQRLLELRGWWLRRMAHGPRPFQEKMVLFWHGHFATSFQKVKSAAITCRALQGVRLSCPFSHHPARCGSYSTR